ncbi:MAG: bifunctional transaldolase/phosoglucose isomerase [Acidobacteria bacterium]|nr:bifunctional transaldolase/phosoglucose isomerase [Acidobacteriota bacterium]
MNPTQKPLRTGAEAVTAVHQTLRLPAAFAAEVEALLEQWATDDVAGRLWAHDASLWTSSGEEKWLGWLDIVSEQRGHLERFLRLAEDVRQNRPSGLVLLGMGGSSLAPQVLSNVFGSADGFPELLVLDTTDPVQIAAVENAVDLASTWFIVSSKSGTTLEPNILLSYFFQRVEQALGRPPGRRFIAVTDPGSPLEGLAQEDGFRHLFHGVPSIGGRYSALSDFGLVPAALTGLDVAGLLDRAGEMVEACAADNPVAQNPGLVLGAVLGAAARAGRDKVTILPSNRVRSLGAWLEQLLAESTGKRGKGLIPVDGEQPGPPSAYGNDRLFVRLAVEGDDDDGVGAALDRIEQAGHPIVDIMLRDRQDLGQEFFHWEIATAAAGMALGINPFDQPDVEAAKVAARRLTDEVESTGALPPQNAFYEEDGLQLFADQGNEAELAAATGGHPSLAAYLKAHLARALPSDYVAIVAFLAMSPANIEQLQALRHTVRNHRRVATCLGFGPRFLHSTGQAYKGGPNSGVFLQLTATVSDDLPVPGRSYTFGTVEEAQARGDLEVLAERGRRLLRVHLTGDLAAGLTRLRHAINEALS